MNLPRKLKSGEIARVRAELLEKQAGICMVCRLECSATEAVLDHCHRGGQIRAVLHRGCNALLGKAENNAPRYGLKLEQLIAFLVGASEYVDFHRENRSGLIHPSHFTPEEKLDRRKIKAKKARVKAKKAKLDAKQAAQQLQSPSVDQHDVNSEPT